MPYIDWQRLAKEESCPIIPYTTFNRFTIGSSQLLEKKMVINLESAFFLLSKQGPNRFLKATK